MRYTTCLSLLTILLGLLSPWCVDPARAADAADTLYTGGAILTMNDAQPTAEAVAVSEGRIVAVGSLEALSPYRDKNTRAVDLEGRALLPGFVDSHGHVVMGGLQALSANLLAPPDGEVRDITSLLDTLRGWISENQQAVESAGLIVGFGYDPAQLAELRHPTRDDLDGVSTDVPVIVMHQSGHFGAFNSVALERVGITADTPDPESFAGKPMASRTACWKKTPFSGHWHNCSAASGRSSLRRSREPVQSSGRASGTPPPRMGARCRAPWRSRKRWAQRAASTSIS